MNEEMLRFDIGEMIYNHKSHISLIYNGHIFIKVKNTWFEVNDEDKLKNRVDKRIGKILDDAFLKVNERIYGK